MRLIDRLFKRATVDRFHVTDQAILDRFLANSDFPWLVSFPRTGSHWLRMIMELYFEKPSLRRIFFYPDAKDFTCYHWHDVDLTTHGVKSVIYLYRHPIDTVYSTLRYHKEDTADPGRARHWADTYARHLAKWIFEETFTRQKTLIRYEGLHANPAEEFGKVCEHLDAAMDVHRLSDAMARVSKEKLKTLTRDDEQVVDLSQGYDVLRNEFRSRSGNLILDTVAAVSHSVAALWPEADEAQ